MMRFNRILVRANGSFMCLKSKVFSHQIMVVLAGLIFSSPVLAYIGPGAGLSAIGSVLALVGAVLLMILGFVWYPVKRLLARRKQESLPAEEAMEFSEVAETDQNVDLDINQSKQG